MADSKLTALTAASSVAGADLVYVVQSGLEKRATVTQLLAVANLGNLATVDEVTNDVVAAAAAIELSKLEALATNRLLVSNGSGVISESAVTSTEAGHLSGVTSPIQSQINARQLSSEKDQANGYAGLDSSGKINTSALPALAITETSVVASQAAMLALTAQPGDVAVRTDLNKTFILTASPASTLANWQELLTPTDLVTSVAGKTGVVTLAAGDIASGTFAVARGGTGLSTLGSALQLLRVNAAGNALEYFTFTGAGIDGTGTAGAIAKFSDADTIGDSLLNQVGSVIGFGGVTASFPGLKRSGANLQAKLADDSDFTNLHAFQFEIPNYGVVLQYNSLLISRDDSYIGFNMGDVSAVQARLMHVSGAPNLALHDGGSNYGGLELGTLYLFDGSVKTVTYGANDSGGSGFKLLRIPN